MLSATAKPPLLQQSKPATSLDLRQAALFCLLVGLCGSCPVAISPKQTGFYVTPSYPFYVLALALCCAESIAAIRSRIAVATLGLVQQRSVAVSAVALLALDALGRLTKERVEVEVNSPRVTGLAYSMKFDKLFIAADEPLPPPKDPKIKDPKK